MITLRFGGYQPPRSVHTRGLRALRDAVSRGAGDIVGIELVENVVDQGRKAADLFTMVAKGELDGCYFASSYLAGRVAALGVLDLPFQAGSREAIFAALDRAGGALLARHVADATEFDVLGYWDNGIRHISNGVRPIRTPADCVGLNLRTLDNALHQAAFAALGFRPIFIDVAELARAVAERRVDAQENPLTNMVNFGLQAHHKFVSLTGHLQGVALLLVNRARFDALPPVVAAAVTAAARESEALQRAAAAAEDSECVRVLAEAGVVAIERDAIDLPAFQAAVADVVQAGTATLDPEVRRAFVG